GQARLRQLLQYRRTEPAGHAVVLDRHDGPGVGADLAQQRAVERLDEAGVDDPDLRPVAGGSQRVPDRRSHAQQPHRPAGGSRGGGPLEDLPTAPLDVGPLRYRRVGGGGHAATRPAYGLRPAERQRGLEHGAHLVHVTRHGDTDVRDGAQVGQVVDALVRRAVTADQARPVDREHHVEVLEGDVVDHLVVAALQERRVDGHDGLLAPQRQPGAYRHRHVLGDANVDVAPRVHLAVAHQAAALAHGGRDDPYAVVGRGQRGGGLSEGLGPGVARPLGHRVDRVEAAGAVPGDRVRLGGLVALALARDDVEHGRPVEFTDAAQVEDDLVDVVSVDGTDVPQTHGVERVVAGGVEEAPRRLLGAAAQVGKGFPHAV